MAICPDIRESFLSLMLLTCYVHMERNVQILHNVLYVYNSSYDIFEADFLLEMEFV